MNSSLEKLKNNLSSQIESAYEFAAQSLMQDDRDLYRLCLYEKDLGKRLSLMAFFALLTQIEKIPAIVSEKQMGVLRIKWWYDALSESENLKDEQTQILLALKDSIENDYLKNSRLLDLLQHLSAEILLPTTMKNKDFEAHYKAKGKYVAKALNLSPALCENLMMLRGLRVHEIEEKCTLPVIEPQDKDDKFQIKTAAYCALLIIKIRKSKPLRLNPLDLLILHFI